MITFRYKGVLVHITRVWFNYSCTLLSGTHGTAYVRAKSLRNAVKGCVYLIDCIGKE